ncbi:hypothetical protein N7471_005247 [Penicillium samsonianum]|uniref:uncharacterized protein n=1 Tax=Penicillium samsonianum TaxID=1882272 RepID=UPI002548D094|nr:uncharacterized protein N7471_005247 [Penicillium samsonianum]KAJ6138761.1 hypothetical protein N7471_005247 [Penicillium samsonianum]
MPHPISRTGVPESGADFEDSYGNFSLLYLARFADRKGHFTPISSSIEVVKCLTRAPRPGYRTDTSRHLVKPLVRHATPTLLNLLIKGLSGAAVKEESEDSPLEDTIYPL